MSLVEVPAHERGGEYLFGAGQAKIVMTWRARPECRETMAGRLEVGIDRRLTHELRAGDVVALGPDGSGSVVLKQNLGPWDDRDTLGPLTAWLAEWATDSFTGAAPFAVTRFAG